MNNKLNPWETKPRSELTAEDIAAWDRWIETDFQRVRGESKKSHQKRRRERYIGSPWGFYSDAVLATKGNQTALALALCIYNRTIVCDARTVTLAGADLAELEIVRSEKNRALQRLQIAGLVQLQPTGPGRRTKINLLWTGRNCIDIKDQG